MTGIAGWLALGSVAFHDAAQCLRLLSAPMAWQSARLPEAVNGAFGHSCLSEWTRPELDYFYESTARCEPQRGIRQADPTPHSQHLFASLRLRAPAGVPH